MSLLKKILFLIVISPILLLLAYIFLPWHIWLENEIKSQLADRGMEALHFELGDVHLEGITFENISLGDNSPFTLDSVTLGYAFMDLLSGKVKELHTGELVFTQGDMNVRIDGLNAFVTPDKDSDGMSGTWTLNNIRVDGTPIAIPLLQGKGTFDLHESFNIVGNIKDANRSHQMAFDFTYPLDDADKALFTLKYATLPWNEGKIRVGKVRVPLKGKKSFYVPVSLSHVSLNNLLQQAAGDQTTASGAVSGNIAVTVSRTGKITVHKGNLKAVDDGIISLPGHMIPGDHPQVDLVRQILKNFHYHDISLSLHSDNPNKLSMLLSLKGNNPEVYNGRRVNLNVNLTGDLLDLLQQGMNTIVDPKRLLKQGLHETD